ncbi:MAG: hypothetical protein JWR06_594 [Jatrophihabitans sp.]|jgi:hypothetical protein|nr:hypothetical protein [Jatrophihabitans sp.]MCW2656401.1 hypothetical protein [Jatrophihabitans sp.]MDT4905720.1 hypothetical protein [Pseudonocardiales bacterium]MDT4931767.1 hypothetical protein [Pseudonocardiales bacterium]
MGLNLLVFGVVMAGVAVGVAVYCVIVEMSEAWDISHRGWSRGHWRHHTTRPGR